MISFLLNRLRHDKHSSGSAANEIMFSASLLQITEYEFFRVAYREWFIKEITEPDLEIIFNNYISNGNAPPWVRHFTRKVAELHENELLDPAELNIKYRTRTKEMVTKGRWYFITVVLVLILFCYLVATEFPPD